MVRFLDHFGTKYYNSPLVSRVPGLLDGKDVASSDVKRDMIAWCIKQGHLSRLNHFFPLESITLLESCSK